MRQIKLMVVILFLVIFNTSCVRPSDIMPGIDLPLSKMNQDIELIPGPGGMGDPRNDEMYLLKIRNLSDQTIVFPNDYGVRLFTKNNDDWKEVENKMSYPDGDIRLPVAQEFAPGIVMGILPYILDLEDEVTLRVIVVGHPENSPDRGIGAYVDVRLHSKAE